MARHSAIKIDGVGSVLVKSEFRGDATINVQDVLDNFSLNLELFVRITHPCKFRGASELLSSKNGKLCFA